VVLVQGSTGVTIENGTIIGGGAGVRLDSGSGQFTLRRLNIRDGRTGIGTAAGNSRGQIVDNLIENIGDEGISASGSAIQVRNNLVSADGKGIKVDNCESCQIVSNTVQDASDAGITLEGSNGVLIRDNTVSGGDVGIRVGQGGYHHVEGNVCTGNASFGLYFKSTSFSCVYRRNTARNNAGSGCAGPTTADFCDEGSGNTSHGDNYLPDLR
jgi:parallel beta-helix repeat protein